MVVWFGCGGVVVEKIGCGVVVFMVWCLWCGVVVWCGGVGRCGMAWFWCGLVVFVVWFVVVVFVVLL